MSLASVLSPFVPADVRRRGETYLREGRVKLAVCDGSKVTASVTGTGEYDIVLTRDGSVVWANCHCLFFLDRMEICKHLWATVLAADPKGGLRGPRGGLPTQILADESPWEEDWEEDEEFEALDRSVPALPQPAPPPPPPGWREILAPLARADILPATRGDEVLFVLDLPASVKRQGLTLDLFTFQRKQDGSRGALRPLRMTRGDAAQHRDPLVREIFALLSGAMVGDPYLNWSYSGYQEVPRQPWVPDALAWEVARRLCATGRFHLRLRFAEMGQRKQIQPSFRDAISLSERLEELVDRVLVAGSVAELGLGSG
ncbi:MAG TPA: hypothetical protein VFE33_14030 [Thermoanaerobaculia bacterium]|nr:hypothetical protein [Thermoanaerobaculia bacterium]